MTSSHASTPSDAAPDPARGATATFFVNGAARTWQSGISLRDLLAELDADGFGVAVELDGQVVRRADYDSLTIAEGARVEVVRLVGGG